MNSSALTIIGAAVFLIGGGVLALWGGAVGTGLGTTLALAGAALIGCGWIRRSSDDDDAS